MKKTLALLLALVMLLAMAACGSTPAENTPAPADTPAPAENTPAPADTPAPEAEGSGDDGTVYKVGISQLVTHVALDAASQGFMDALTEKLGDRVEFDYQNAANDSATCSTIANAFVAAGVDLIMANATPALVAASAATADIPILGTSITEYGVALQLSDFSGTVGGNISGTSDLPPLDQQAAMIQEWFPDATNVGLLYCSNEANSLYQITAVQACLEELGYTCTQYTFSDSNDIAAVCQTAADNSDVLYIPTDNAAASNTGIIDNICRGNVPIICGEEGICAGCGVATLSISYYDIGYKTGEMAYEILVNGADISTMPIEYAPEFVKKYNPTICDDLGLTAPEGYEAIEG